MCYTTTKSREDLHRKKKNVVVSWAPGLNWAFNSRMNKNCIRPKNKGRPFSCVASQQFSSFQGTNTTLIFTAPCWLLQQKIEKEGDHSRKFSSILHSTSMAQLRWSLQAEIKWVSKRRLLTLKWSSSCPIYWTLLTHIKGTGKEYERENLCFLSPCYFPKH